jgi:seryl-tRNA synthetase
LLLDGLNADQYELITMRKDVNILDKKIREFKFAKQDAEKLVTEKKNLEGLIDLKEKEMEEVQEIRDAFLRAVGNLVHETVPCHKDEVGIFPHAFIIAQKE